MKIYKFFLLVILSMHFNFSTAFADPSSSGFDNDATKPVNVDYKRGYDEISNGNYQLSIKYLLKAAKTSPDNPDVYNLLGFSHRKLDKVEDAFFYYQKALKLDPRHQGANEYIGELYLQTNNLKKAEEHLEVLDDICLFGCEEYDDLKDAIEKYKKSM
jgi:tetratricopeptide (TPR) repeat protein